MEPGQLRLYCDARYVLHGLGVAHSGTYIPVEFCSYGIHCFYHPNWSASFRNPILFQEDFRMRGVCRKEWSGNVCNKAGIAFLGVCQNKKLGI